MCDRPFTEKAYSCASSWYLENPSPQISPSKISIDLCATTLAKRAKDTILYEVFYMGKIASEPAAEHCGLCTFLA